MSVFNRNRGVSFLSPLFSAASAGGNVDKLMKNLKSLIYPEDKWDDVLYIKKAKEMFEKFKKINLYIQPMRR